MNLLGSLAIAILWPVLAAVCLAAFVCSCVSDGLVWAFPTGRAATTSWLSRSASSCQHRIPNAGSAR
jgi:hypothetical protein